MRELLLRKGVLISLVMILAAGIAALTLPLMRSSDLAVTPTQKGIPLADVEGIAERYQFSGSGTLPPGITLDRQLTLSLAPTSMTVTHPCATLVVVASVAEGVLHAIIRSKTPQQCTAAQTGNYEWFEGQLETPSAFQLHGSSFSLSWPAETATAKPLDQHFRMEFVTVEAS